MKKDAKPGKSMSITVKLPLDLEESFPIEDLRLKLQLAAGNLNDGVLPSEARRRAAVSVLDAVASALWPHERDLVLKPTQQAASVADALLRHFGYEKKRAIMEALQRCGLGARSDGAVRVALHRIQANREALRAGAGSAQSKSFVHKRKEKRTPKASKKR